MAGPAGRVGHEHDTRSNRRAAAKIGAERKLVAAIEKLTNREQPPPGAEAGRSFDEDSVERALAGEIPVEIRKELAGSCAQMAAVATENDPAKRLRWALKGRNFVNNHHLARYEEACALHDLEYFKAAVDRFNSLWVDIDGGNRGNLTKNMVDDVKRRTTRPTDIDIKVARGTNGEQPEIVKRAKELPMARLQILRGRTSMLNKKRYDSHMRSNCSHMRSKKGQEIMAKENVRNLPVLLLNYVSTKDIEQLLKYEFTEATTDDERDKAVANLTMINAKQLLEDCTEPKVSLRAKVDLFLKVNDTSGPLITDAGDCLLELLRARRGPELTVISWNAQLMNTTDRPDTQFENSMRKKAKNIVKVMIDAGAHLLVIQEAPGPHLKKYGGTNAKRIANEEVFNVALCNELRSKIGANPFTAQGVELPNENGDQLDKEGKPKEMGENHVYVYNSSVLTPMQRPLPLPHAEGDKWISRAPSFAMFKVSKGNNPKEEKRELLVISVHAKSGADYKTEGDVAMIGRAVNKKLEEMHERGEELKKNGHPDNINRAVLVLGDFNLDPKRVKKILGEKVVLGMKEAFGWSKSVLHPNDDVNSCTNIWQFNGSGDVKQDGKSYDSAFFWSSDSSGIEGGLAPLPDVDKTVKEMQEVAKIIQTHLSSLRSLPLSEMTNDVLKGLTELQENVPDGTPSWLRKEFQKSVKFHWSDHKPIKMTITMPE